MPVTKNTRKNGKQVKYTPPKKPSQREVFIAEAKQIRVACLGLIANCAQISQIVKAAHANPEVVLDEEKVGALSTTLAKDLSTLKGELDTIDTRSNAAIDAITDKTDDIEVMNITIQVANDYQNWQDRLSQVAGPVMEQITELCLPKEIL